MLKSTSLLKIKSHKSKITCFTCNMSHLLTQIVMTKLSLVSPFVKKFKVKWFGSGNRK